MFTLPRCERLNPDRPTDGFEAYVDQATAVLALGRVAEAVTAYEAALAREATVPNVLTQAYSELPYLIATHRIREQYARALELLHLHESRLTFPVDRFRWHAAFALIAADTHEAGNASIHARQALAAAALARSGFRHHPSFGLVRVQNADIIKRLEALSATDPER